MAIVDFCIQVGSVAIAESVDEIVSQPGSVSKNVVNEVNANAANDDMDEITRDLDELVPTKRK